MATTADYLTQLQKDKQTLVDNLVSKGVNASSNETFTFLVPKVAEIKSGSSEAKLENLTINPTEEQQVFNHPGSDGYNNVIVNPIPDEYIIPTGTLEVTENGEYDVTEKDKVNVSVEATGGVTISDCSYLFHYNARVDMLDELLSVCKNITKVDHMFQNASNIRSLDLSGLDFSQVQNMEYMFQYCTNLPSIDLTGWNTQNVTSMKYMFGNMGSLTQIDMRGLNTSNVTTMQNMLNYCSSLVSANLSELDTEKVTNTSSMLSGCSSLTTLIINTPNVFPMTNVNMLGSTPIKNGTGYVYVPDDLVETYKTATNWSTYASQIKGMSELPTEEV